MTAAFTGLRASELRGLRWSDVDLATGTVHVRQRADAWGSIGQPKTHTGQRAIPIGPFVVNMLKEWKLACPKVSRILVSPAATVVRWCTRPCSMPATGPRSAPPASSTPKASRNIPACMRFVTFSPAGASTARQDGGLELPLKTVQQRLGHSTIAMTADTYGHLFPRGDDAEELAAAEQALLRPVAKAG